MTDKPTPTDAELEALLLDKLPASKHYIRPVIEKMVAAMQAAIDKWGQPVVAREPIDRGDAVNLARNALTQYDCAITKKGVLVLAEAVLSMDATLTTHAQAGALPLTDEQIKALMQARYTAMLMTCKARVPECGEFSAIAQDLDWLCESLGIKGVSHEPKQMD